MAKDRNDAARLDKNCLLIVVKKNVIPDADLLVNELGLVVEPQSRFGEVIVD
jgi:hypothetical protein